MIYVTHDQEEALTLGDRIAVMRRGSIEQVGAPMEVYRHPASVFVAEFIGSPAINILPAGTLAAWDGGAVTGIRPHDIEIVPAEGADEGARVELVEPLGSTLLLHARLDRRPDVLLRLVAPADAGIGADARVGLRLRPDRLHRFDPATGLSMSTR
jgi:ABC-type sugar transport system ATPase subunit